MSRIILIIIFYFFSSSINLNAQDKIIELAISYDSQYADAANGEPDVRIAEVIQGVNDVYDKYGIQFLHVGPFKNFGYQNLATQNNTRIISQSWTKTENCFERDLVIHFSGSELSNSNVVGEANGNRLCKSSTTDFLDPEGGTTPFAVISKYQSFIMREIRTTAHELGHAMGLSHEEDTNCDVCNDEFYFICESPTGGWPEDPKDFRLSSCGISTLNSNIQEAVCVDVQNYDPNFECTDFIYGIITNTAINRTCNSHSENVKIIIQNNHIEHDFTGCQLRLRLMEELDLPQFIKDLPVEWTEGDGTKWLGLDNFTLGPNEEYIFEFTINYSSVVTDLTPNSDGIARIAFHADISPDINANPPNQINFSSFPEDRTIVLPNIANTQNLLDAINDTNNGFTNYPNNKIDIVVNGILNIDQDIEVDSKFNFKMGTNARINVINNSSFIFNESSILPCDKSAWDKIYVENGSSLDFRGVHLEGGNTGIETQSGGSNPSNISVTACSFSDFNYFGLKIGNSVFQKEILNNHFQNVQTGVYSESAIKAINNKFQDVTYGINLYKASGSDIRSNKIHFKTRGIIAANSNVVFIKENDIIHEEHNSGLGISLHNTSNIFMFNNLIESNYIGVHAFGSKFLFMENEVVVNNSSLQGGGISANWSNSSQIANNYITGNKTAFGVELNGGFGSHVYSNSIYTSGNSTINGSNSAVRILGSNDQNVFENIIHSESSTTGIYSENSSNGRFDCNDIETPKTALLFMPNSDMQEISTNILQGGVDLRTFSDLGEQAHLGNQFIGGLVFNHASGEIEDNQFLVNSSYESHMPTFINLDNWFADENLTPQLCSSVLGPDWIASFDDPEKVCKYYNELKKLKDSNNKEYLIKVFHLLNHYNLNPDLSIPSCISDDPDLNKTCGLNQLVSMYGQISTLYTKESKDPNVIKAIETMYKLKDDNWAKFDQNDINTINVHNEQHLQKLINKASTLKNDLSLFNCSNSIYNSWAKVLEIYMDYVLGYILSDTQKNEINSIANLCSSEYGDAVNWARALKNTYNPNSNHYNACQEGEIEKRESTTLISNFQIIPNPSNGQFKIKMNHNDSDMLNIEIYNNAGIKVFTQNNLNRNEFIDPHLSNGVYYVRIKSMNAQSIEKLIIVK